MTRQLVKAGLPAGLTVPFVGRLLAAVEAAFQLVAADHRAPVLHIHTAKLSTLMPTTRALLVASPLTREDELIFCLNICTWNILRLGAAAAPDSGGQRAGPAAPLVA